MSERPVDAAVIGAGPYGLACTAFLRSSGAEVAAFGEPMRFWQRRMPDRMLLRSRRRSSHFADPDGSLSLDAYEEDQGVELGEPIKVTDFVRYGLWYQDRMVPDLDQRWVREVNPSGDAFKLTLEDGTGLTARHVVVAAGLAPFPFRAPPLGELSAELASHSSDHDSFERFRDARVLVVGGGQSALESAALLTEAGAEVELVARAPGITWLGGGKPRPLRTFLWKAMTPPTDVGGRVTGWLGAMPDVLRRLPPRTAAEVGRRCTVPAGAGWLRDRLEDVPLTVGREVIAGEQTGEGVRVSLDDGGDRQVDHVLLATGWRIDVSEYPFLGDALLGGLERRVGYPVLRGGMQSSVPGLHFVGAPAALSFGPIMRFVVGTWYAAPVVARAVMSRRQRPVRVSYRPRIGSPATT